MKKWIVTAAVILIVGTGIGIWWHRDHSAAPPAPAPTAKIERGLLRIVVQTTGNVVSNQDVDIKCRASGTVIKLPFDISDHVKVGDVLLQLDTVDEDPVVRAAKATVNAAEAQLAEAKQTLAVAKANLITDRMRAQADLLSAQSQQRDAKAKRDRTSELFNNKLASQEDLDTATTAAAQADAGLMTAQAAVEALKAEELGIGLKENDIQIQQANLDKDQINLDIDNQQVGYTTVLSPIDGVVSSLTSGTSTTRIGTVVQSGTSNVSGGTTVMTITDLSHIFVYATVDESDIGQVRDPQDHPGQPLQKVKITADAYPGVEFEGQVVRVATKGVNTSNVVTFEVRIEVVSPNKKLLKPAMTANVEIINTEKPDVLLIPAQAVVRKKMDGAKQSLAAKPATQPETQVAATQSDGGTSRKEAHKHKFAGVLNGPSPAMATVVMPDGKTELVDIVIGQTDGVNYELLSGLTEGQTVELNKSGADSRWKSGNNFKGSPMMMH